MNCMHLATEGVLLTRLRYMRRELVQPSPNVRSYRILATLAPTLGVWVETKETEDGFEILAQAGLSKDHLRALWDNEELELQQLNEDGEWEDAFQIMYPDKDPVEIN